jgi:hypothetical protein
MKSKLLIGAGLVVAFAMLAGCGTEEVKTEPEAGTVTETVTETVQAEEPTTEQAPESVEPPVAGVGDSISLAGYETGYRIKLVKIAKDAKSSDPYFGPERGNRYFAAYVQVSVTDGAPTEVCASNDASVIDAQGQTFTGDILDSVKPAFGCPKIGVGSKRAGWVTFEVPKRAKIVTFSYTPDSGFAEETGEWVTR